MPHVFRRKKDRIEIKLLQILSRKLLQRLAEIGKRSQALIAPARVRWQVAAAVRRANFQSWKKVQRSILNQMSDRECSLKRMSDDIVQKSISLQPFFVDRRPSGLRMDKNQSLQLLGLRPKRMKLGRGKIVSIHAAADGEATHPQILHAVIHLLDGKRWVLQGHAPQASEAFRMRGAKFRNFHFLNLDNLALKIHLRPIPKWIDRNGL